MNGHQPVASAGFQPPDANITTETNSSQRVSMLGQALRRIKRCPAVLV